MDPVRIPPIVRAELANPSPNGDRHRQMKDLVLSLLGNGLTPKAVYSQFRAMYDEDVSDREIWSVIKWAAAKNPKPSGWNQTPPPSRTWNRQNYSKPRQKIKATGEAAIQNARDWLRGFSCDEADLWECSKVPLSTDWQEDAILFLESLYQAEDLVCINTKYRLETKKDGTKKAVITGAGQTMEASSWTFVFEQYGVPIGDAGVWVRLNPLKEVEGSGRQGAHTDNDVARFQYLLIESDTLPIDLQLSVLGKLKLPIAAIYLSGGVSAHTAVKQACPMRRHTGA